MAEGIPIEKLLSTFLSAGDDFIKALNSSEPNTIKYLQNVSPSFQIMNALMIELDKWRPLITGDAPIYK